LNGKPTLQDLLEVQQVFGLPSPALVEKDWYVMRALAAIASLDIEPLRLVFGGDGIERLMRCQAMELADQRRR